MDHLPRNGVWLCPTCDYGETSEFRQQRLQDEPDELDTPPQRTIELLQERDHVGATTLQDFEDGFREAGRRMREETNPFHNLEYTPIRWTQTHTQEDE